MRLVPLIVLLTLAACGHESQSWEGWALRDRPGESGTRLVGGYNDVASCRAGLLASDSDPSSEALVCTQGCPKPHDGMIEGCVKTLVVRAAEWQPPAAPDPLPTLPPDAEPVNAADRSPDSGPSRP